MIDLSTLAGTLGDYARDPDVKTDFLYGMMFNPALEDRIEVITGVIDEIPIPNMLISDPLAPIANLATVVYKEDVFEPDANILKVKDCILATKVIPAQLWASYMGLLDRENYKRKKLGQDPFKLPFEEFLFNLLKEKAMSSMYELAIFKGIRNNAGTTSSDLFDGFLKKISDAVTATDLTEVATGEIDNTNIIEKLWLVVDSLGEAQKNGRINLHLPGKIYDYLSRAFTPVVNGQVVATGPVQIDPFTNQLRLTGTNAVAVREPGMGDTNRVIATVPGNLFLGFNADPNAIAFEIQKVDLSLKILMHFKAGTAIGLLKDDFQSLAVNDLVVSS